MPRSQPSQADSALLAALAEQSLQVSPYQLERWRAAGLLPRNRRRGLGRGHGSTSKLDETAVVCASALARIARQGQRLVGGHVVERLAIGLPAAEEQVRAAFAAELDSLADRLAGDAPDTDDGWQRRYDTAARIARRERLPVDGQELLAALFGEPARPEPSRVAEHAAIRTMLRTLSASEEVIPDELLEALATAGYISPADLPHVLADHQAAELAGIDTCNEVMPARLLDRLRAIVQTASLDELQRAVAAVWMAWTYQGLVIFVGMARIGGMDETKMSAWPQITADTVRKLQDDPVWMLWGQYQGLFPYRGGSPAGLVVAGLSLLVVPGMLAAVEGYRDRLAQLGHAANHNGSSEGD